MIPFEAAAANVFLIGTLVVLEGLLSADNALVLALLVKHLPPVEQRKALLYGLLGAFLLRAIALFFARYLLNLWWLCGVGAVYLIGLAAHHFLFQKPRSSANGGTAKTFGRGFWATVLRVEFTDIVFALDSILVAVALVNDPNRLWVVYTGAFIGITMLRIAASFVLRLLARYPALDHMAYLLVGWSGLKLASGAIDIRSVSLGLNKPHFLTPELFWIGFALILLFGSLYAVRQGGEVGAIASDNASDGANSGSTERPTTIE